jgi:protein-arginine kinase activator protein McsA
MSNHRLKCRNAVCAFNGMMEAKSDQPFVKKAFLDKALAKLKSSGMTATSPMMQVRCPKCGMRWKMRSDQLH